MCDLSTMFGGPSSTEEASQAKTQSLANTYTADFNQNYQNQQNILGTLQNTYTPIVQAGPEQQGWSGAEAAAINTQIGEGVGTNYSKASQALNNNLAAQGGGNEYLPTGARAALKGSLASSAANQLSSEQLAATQANYAQGRSNWQTALSGLSNVSSQENPTAYGTLGSNAENTAFGEANTIQQQKASELGNIIGDVTSVASSFIPGGGALKALTGMFGKGGSGGGGSNFTTPGGFNSSGS